MNKDWEEGLYEYRLGRMKITEKVDKLICHDKWFQATGTDKVSFETRWWSVITGEAKDHPLRDEKVANVSLLTGSFFFFF